MRALHKKHMQEFQSPALHIASRAVTIPDSSGSYSNDKNLQKSAESDSKRQKGKEMKYKKLTESGIAEGKIKFRKN
jgi:hypothetical protein